MSQSEEKIYSTPKKIIFSIIIAVVSFLIIDSFVGIGTFLFVKPIDIAAGLPQSISVRPHPYKSYINEPGQVRYIQGEALVKFPGINDEYDFGLFEDGTVVNEFGHLVKREDLLLHKEDKSASELRILCLGGSTTFLPWPFLIPEALDAIDKSERFKEIRIVNAGTGGYTSQENLIDLIICGFSYKPDIVLAYLPINDIYQAAHYPGFKRDYTHTRIPLKKIVKNNIQPPPKKFHNYPFVWKFADVIIFNKKMKEYIKNVDLGYYTNIQPPPYTKGHLLNSNDFEKTTEAIIDNIYNMKSLCESRGVKFLLVTQKIFLNNTYYKIMSSESKILKYYKLMDEYTLKSIDDIVKSDLLSNIDILEMHKQFPDKWNDKSIRKIKSIFPDRNIDFKQLMSYDSMHFSPSGCFLFSAIVSDKINKIIN